MLSIDYIRKNPEKVKEAAKNKNREVDIDKILSLDDARRESLQLVQKLREERNSLAKNSSRHPELVSGSINSTFIHKY